MAKTLEHRLKLIQPVSDSQKQFMLEQLDRCRESVTRGEVTGIALAVSYRGGGAGTAYCRAYAGSHFTLLGAIQRTAYRLQKVIDESCDD